MSLRFASEPRAYFRHGAQLLIERAGDHERQLEAFVAAVDTPTRTSFAAVLTKPSPPETVLATVHHVAGL
jgi:hypothetical protein